MSRSVRPMSSLVALAYLSLVCLPSACAHSEMSWPQSTSPKTCRRGGERRSGIVDCPGPCDMRFIQKGWFNYGANNPAATYRRGQRVDIKYQRNNHGPGGFERLTLVPLNEMMNKAAHSRNAFHYSCWGAKPVVAKPSDIKRDKYGFSISGNDGAEHHFPKAFYKTTVTIPTCVPDGVYVLGWVWYGGTGSPVTGNSVQEPWPYGFFSDYWSCSYVRIQGGSLTNTCKAVFINDMKQYSKEGCMSANDSPGVCTYEPCKVMGKYQKPRPFKNGNSPPLLRKSNFGGGGGPKPKPRQRKQPKQRKPKQKRGRRAGGVPTGFPKMDACRCIAQSRNCSWDIARRSKANCQGSTDFGNQPDSCKNACCQFCLKHRWSSKICRGGNVSKVCARRG